MEDCAPLSRCLLVWLAATAAAAGLLALLLPTLATAVSAVRAPAGAGLERQPFDVLLVWLCAATALGCVLWLWVVTTLVAAQAARGVGSLASAGVPPGVRRVVLAACGVALAGSVATPALATPGPVHVDRTGRAARALLEGLPLPDRASGGATLRSSLAAATGAWAAPHATSTLHPSDEVLVEPGDSLWAIAEAALPPGAGAATIQRGWHRIHAANRRVLGGDPDLIHPGQRLRLPPVTEE